MIRIILALLFLIIGAYLGIAIFYCFGVDVTYYGVSSVESFIWIMLYGYFINKLVNLISGSRMM